MQRTHFRKIIGNTVTAISNRFCKTVHLFYTQGISAGYLCAKTGVINGLIYLKNRRCRYPISSCPCCGWEGYDFYWLDCGSFIVPHEHCPNCGAQERHRLMEILTKSKVIDDMKSTPRTVLHFAPESHIYKHFINNKSITYIGVDYCFDTVKAFPFPGTQLDIQALPFSENSIDLIFCLHVLEHIPNDHLAISEIYRVLKPGGTAIIMVPFMMGQKATIEYGKPDPAIFDHMRGYSPNDFADRLRAFSVNTIYPKDLLTDEQIKEYKIPFNSQIIYECHKD